MSRERPLATASAGSGPSCLALFALVFCARAWLIRVWGSPVPYWDQWDADALKLFRPWLDGTLRWADLFAPHNEHRIVLTRLADLGLFLATGSWNTWGQLLLNAVLHATTAALVARLFWPWLSGVTRMAWLLILAVIFTAPAGWQNALWGFQSQVYFEILLSVLAVSGLIGGEPLRSRWWLGWIASLLALFALGSGLLAAATALVVGGFAPLFPRSANSPGLGRTVGGLLLILVVLAVGWMLRVEVAEHVPLRAHSAAQFGAVFARGLAWPWVDSGWLWIVMQAPLLWLVGSLIYRRRMPTTGEQLALGLGLLAALHAAAVAYSRGAGLPEARPLSRYQDALLLGVTGNFFIVLQLASAQRTARIAALAWSGALLAGLLSLTTTNLSLHLPFKRARDAAGLAEVRAYLASKDATVFNRDPEAPRLHPDPAVVRRVIDDAPLRPLLPVEFSDSAASPPQVIESSPWLVLLSGGWLLVMAIRSGRAKEPA